MSVMSDGSPQGEVKRSSMKRSGLSAILPQVWALICPHRWLLLVGFILISIDRVAGFVLPASMKYLLDDIIGRRKTYLLMPLAASILAATFVQALTSFALTQLFSKAAERMIANLRTQVQAHVARLPMSFHDQNKTGALVSRVMDDVQVLRNLVGTGMVEFAGGIVTAFFALFMLLTISRALTLLALLMLICIVIQIEKTVRTLRPIFRDHFNLSAEVIGRLTESLAGVRVVKGYNAEESEEAVFSTNTKRLLRSSLHAQSVNSVLNVFSTASLGAVSTLFLYLGARNILKGSLSTGAFVTFMLFLGLLIAPINQILSIGAQMIKGIAGLERTRDILTERREEDNPQRTRRLACLRGDVRFENVNFSYTGRQLVLREVSFHAKPGTLTAFVGPSGAGKSTIIGLIMAFYTPLSGQLFVDETDLTTARLSSYRSQLGVVFQETFLFDGSVRENVSFARPGASEAEILSACRMAGVDEFAERLEKRYDTNVGERGVRLSGGQRQRMAIARALLADPRILILDEATSSLDSESEALIQSALATLMVGRTTFAIAHRLSTVRRADQIIVLEEGRVVECGSHMSLYAAGGRYHRLYTSQHNFISSSAVQNDILDRYSKNVV